MNILIIPAFFQEKSRPTLGSFFLDQAKALQMAGHQVVILYCDTYSVKCVTQWLNYQEEAEENIDGIRVLRKKCFCPLKHGIEGYRDAFAHAILQLYEQYLLNENIDIIHAHCCVWAGYAAMKLSQKIKIPYVITEHATLFQLHKDEISVQNQHIITDTFRNASKVICVSRAFAELLSEYRKDTEVVGNVVNCDMFAPNEYECGETFTFLTICYMQEKAQLYKKGIDILLKAWKDFIVQKPGSRLIIGGGGKAVKKAVEWCHEYGITESVEFLGGLTRDEVVKQMKQCNCFVLPSRYETFGVVYIEAMACGKPVIAVRNGGPDDFVNVHNGILIAPENVDELVIALKEMVYNRNQYDSTQISNYVKQRFSGKAIVDQLQRIYQNILNKS